jgi:uncharacterized membrane protein YdjX (TVP38/TMEM64 family)
VVEGGSREHVPVRRRVRRWLLILGVVLATFAVLYAMDGRLSAERLIKLEGELVSLREVSPWGAALVALVVYVVVAALSIPGAALLTLLIGWWLGFWFGLLVVSFGSTAGATMACAMSRYLFKDWVRAKLSGKVDEFVKRWEKHGAVFLWSLRLIPAVPFWLVNLMMGLTTIRLRTFWWISQLAMLPATIIYVYAGSTLPSLSELQQRGGRTLMTPEILLALVGLALLPLLTVAAKKWLLRPDVSAS